MHRWTRSSLVVLVALAPAFVLALVPAVAAAPGRTAAALQASLAWGPCPSASATAGRLAVAAPQFPALECALVPVPLDYAQPDGGVVALAVSRLRTAAPATRRGVLLLNPGGPGGSGLDLPLLLGSLMPPEVLQRYDLIGFDPRFVGRSTPISCNLRITRSEQVVPWPLPDQGVRGNAEIARSTAASCAATAGGALPHLSTANNARDMDRIRAALGEPKLSYLGYSYGSYLGAVYASLFPGRTDRVVLDGAVDPRRVWRGQFRRWGPGFEARMDEFAVWAAARDANYRLGDTRAEVRALFARVAERLDRDPIVLFPGRLYTGNELREATRGALSSDELFPALAQGLRGLADVTGSGAVALVRRLASEPFLGVPRDNSVAVLFGTVCGDAAWPRSIERYERDVRRASRRWPFSGGMSANVWPCAFWPYPPREPPVRITARGPANILIPQNTRDPVTPLAGARGLRAVLGHRARLVVADDGGHGTYLVGGNACADAETTRFLLSGKLPARDVRCPATGTVSLGGSGARRQAAREELHRRQAATLPLG